MQSNRSRQAQCSFGSVSFLSLSNFLPEPKTSVSASSHMQVHRERFVPSLISNFMVLELEAGGGGWGSSRSLVFYRELCWCHGVAWWFLLYCSPPGFSLKSSAGVAGDHALTWASAFPGLLHCWAQQSTWKIMTPVERRWGSSAGRQLYYACGESTRECRKHTLPILPLASVLRRDDGTNNPGQMCNHITQVLSRWCWDVVVHVVREQVQNELTQTVTDISSVFKAQPWLSLGEGQDYL